MNPVERITDIRDDAKDLNKEVREAENMTLADARQIVHLCRETEGWLKGVREMLDA